jgi:hypothetical protein
MTRRSPTPSRKRARPCTRARPALASPRSVRPLTRCILATLVSTAVVAAPASATTGAPGPAPHEAAAGSIGVRLVDVPATAGKDPRAQVYITDHLAPGTVIRRRIEVSNTSASTTPVALYAAAAAIAHGSFLGGAGHTADELSTWTSVSPGAAAIPANGRVTATVTITVPADAAPGERYGVVWAEASATPSAGGGITQVSRVGIRLYLSVGPGGAPGANFTIDSLTAKRAADGQPIVVATVSNTGGRALDVNGSLRLSAGPGGLNAGPFPATLGTTLAVGDSEPVTIALDKRIPAGPWDAEITLRSGLLERSAHATITFPDLGASPPVKVTPSRPGGLNPAIAIAVPVVLMLVGISALIVVSTRRGRRPRGRRRKPASPIIAT